MDAKEGKITGGVSTEIKDRIAIVTIMRDKKFNAFKIEIVEELNKIFIEVASNEEVRAMIITREGDKIFCIVGDLEFFIIVNYDDIEIGFSLG